MLFIRRHKTVAVIMGTRIGVVRRIAEALW